jgi:hypothetical protein
LVGYFYASGWLLSAVDVPVYCFDYTYSLTAFTPSGFPAIRFPDHTQSLPGNKTFIKAEIGKNSLVISSQNVTLCLALPVHSALRMRQSLSNGLSAQPSHQNLAAKSQSLFARATRLADNTPPHCP